MRPCEVTRDGSDKLVCFLGHLQRTSPIYHLRPSLNSLPPPPPAPFAASRLKAR